MPLLYTKYVYVLFLEYNIILFDIDKVPENHPILLFSLSYNRR